MDNKLSLIEAHNIIDEVEKIKKKVRKLRILLFICPYIDENIDTK